MSAVKYSHNTLIPSLVVVANHLAAIGGTVVDKNHLQLYPGLPQNTVDTFPKVIGSVVYRDYD